MKFYAYKGKEELGKEPLGTFNKQVIELKTINGAKRRCVNVWGNDYKLYSFTNFYDNKTFQEIK